MGFEEFLKHLGTAQGVVGVVNVLLVIATSFLIELWPAWKNISPVRKRLFFMVPLSLALPLLAAGVGVLYYDWPMAFDQTWWPAFLSGFAAAFGGQLSHTVNLKGE